MEITLEDGRITTAEEIIASLQRLGTRMQALEELLSGSYRHETPGVWITREGKRIPIATMDFQHLENTISFLTRQIDGLSKKRAELVAHRDERIRNTQAARMAAETARAKRDWDGN